MDTSILIKLIDWIKSKKEIMIAFWILSFIGLKAPDSWWAFLQISFMKEIKPYFGMTFAFISSIVAVSFCLYVFNKIHEGTISVYQTFEINRYTKKTIKGFNKSEVSALQNFYYPERVEVFIFNARNPTIIGLLEKKVITPIHGHSGFVDIEMPLMIHAYFVKGIEKEVKKDE